MYSTRPTHVLYSSSHVTAHLARSPHTKASTSRRPTGNPPLSTSTFRVKSSTQWIKGGGFRVGWLPGTGYIIV